MKHIYADLHIHIGRTDEGLPVKITAAKNMSFHQIIRESSTRKGIHMIGVIDAHSPPVQNNIEEGLRSGLYQEHPNGGIVFEQTTCILGAEIELKEPGCGAFHVLAYFPNLKSMKEFTSWLTMHMKNTQLSTQRLYQSAQSLQEKVEELEGILVPAHIFTPFKSVYGSSTQMLHQLFDTSRLGGVELGLSSDSNLADQISELKSLPFLTNSDAHSIPKIGREYNEFLMKEASFQELRYVLLREKGRKIVANYGLNPQLGKYHRTRCADCSELWGEHRERCAHCGSLKFVKGVYDRIQEIADQKMAHPPSRPPYIYQVPLEFIPGLGSKGIDRLLDAFQTEMNIIHVASIDELAQVTTQKIANYIHCAREQRLQFEEGGGGVYGRVK